MSKPKHVLVYKGRGVGPLSFRETLATLKAYVPPGYVVSSVDLDSLVSGEILKEAALFAMPGGRDVPYDEDLRGPANANLRDFVRNGGAYLGICAGAYYGAAQVSFEIGHPLEVTGSRELAFFPGEACGTVYQPGGFRYDTEEVAHAARLKTNQQSFHAYYNGGCYFKNAGDYQPNVQVIATYDDVETGPEAAIVSCKVGTGRVILTGAHLDYRPMSVKGKVADVIFDALTASDEARIALVRSLLAQLLRF